MNTRCPTCNVILYNEVWQNYVTHRQGAPWRARYELSTGDCPNCGTVVRQEYNGHTDTPLVWSRSFEFLKWGRDYQVIQTRRRGRSRLNVKPVNVLWMWMPVLDNYWVTQMEERALEVAGQPDRATVLVFPHVNADVVGTNVAARADVDEVWVLSPDVTLAARGPYPSLRAELTIAETFSRFELENVYHFWPAASLFEGAYKPLGTDDQIAKAWAGHARQNHRVLVQALKES